MGSVSRLQGIFPTPGSNLGLPHCGRILYHLSHKGEVPRILACGEPIPSPADLRGLGIELGPPALRCVALQADSLLKLSQRGSSEKAVVSASKTLVSADREMQEVSVYLSSHFFEHLWLP